MYLHCRKIYKALDKIYLILKIIRKIIIRENRLEKLQKKTIIYNFYPSSSRTCFDFYLQQCK